MGQEQFLVFPLWYVVFLLSITCHEAAHAFVAYRGGDPTAYLGGQVTLNPLPHVRRELLGTVVVPVLSFLQVGWPIGWASAPYDPVWERRHPKRAAMMAAAGPAANLGLALIAFVVLKVGLAAGTWLPPSSSYIELDRLVVSASESPDLWNGLGRLFSVMLTLNFVLLLFNLLPLPPMDGAAVAAGLFEPARTLGEKLRAQPLAGLLGLILAWYLFRYVFGALFTPVLTLLF